MYSLSWVLALATCPPRVRRRSARTAGHLRDGKNGRGFFPFEGVAYEGRTPTEIYRLIQAQAAEQGKGKRPALEIPGTGNPLLPRWVLA